MVICSDLLLAAFRTRFDPGTFDLFCRIAHRVGGNSGIEREHARGGATASVRDFQVRV